MEYKDYYKTLGVERDAAAEDIKRAYRRLARKYHPDVSKESDAEARFKELGEAYEVLKNPEKRAAYDALGNQWKAGQDFRPPPDWDANYEFTGDVPPEAAQAFSDFFDNMFRDARRGGTSSGHYQGGVRMRGQDRHAKILIDLEDAYSDSTKTIALQHPVVSPDGRLDYEKRTLNVRIPKGVRPGQHIRLSGQGEPGVGGAAAGDLYLEIAFRPHSVFRTEGADLHFDLPVAPWEAALGAKIKVPTPAGAVDLSIPAGSSGGRRLRLRGRGIPGNPPGDIYAQLRIALPPADSERSRQVYEDMAKEMPFNPRAGMGV